MLLVLLILMGVAQGLDRISFDLGPINFQPAELAKFTTLIALCAFLAEERSDEVSYPRFLGGLIIVGAPGGADHRPARPRVGVGDRLDRDGRAARRRCQGRYIALISSCRSHRRRGVRRAASSTVPDGAAAGLPRPGRPSCRTSIYQVRNAIRAVGTGGVWGKGWLQGPLTNGRDIPVMWADFPFAAVGEQFGLVGCAVLLALFVVALMRIWRIATLSRDLLGTYLCAGVFTMLLWQVFQNVGMTLGIMPVTGLPMPFISYGGSSLIMYFAMFGMVQIRPHARMR